MQTKNFPSVIAVKKSTKPLIEQYKNMMDTEQAPEIAELNDALLKSIGEVAGCEEHVHQLKAQIEHIKQVIIGDRIEWEDFPPASRLAFAQLLKDYHATNIKRTD